jgi:hypothetical protein
VKVAIYARYSSDNQRDASIADQLRLCREYAGRQGWTVVQEFTDHAISGAALLRSGFQALMRDALNRRFDVVLAESLDRFSRDQEDTAGLFKRLTGKRISRLNPEVEWIAKKFRPLRILSDEVWNAAKDRQSATRRTITRAGDIGFARRPQYLFSGLSKCGICGAGFIMAGRNRLACFGAREKGMRRCAARLTLPLVVALVPIVGCTVQETGTAERDTALAARIEQLVETFLTSDDDAKTASVLSDARAIFEREGIPSRTKVGDGAAYGFVLINMLGQPPDFRLQLFERVQEEVSRQGLPQDALAFGDARRRQTELQERYRAHVPSHPQLVAQISQLLKEDQAVREREGFDLGKMEEADRRTAGPLKAIFDRYGVPTYEMVGVQAAKDFVVMVQHQPPEFRLAVLPKLKANVDSGQADPGSFAMVYDRTQRDQGKNQLYGQQLECATGKTLDVAPIDDAKNVNIRRAELGLMRLELYVRLVRHNSPDLCGSAASPK